MQLRDNLLRKHEAGIDREIRAEPAL